MTCVGFRNNYSKSRTVKFFSAPQEDYKPEKSALKRDLYADSKCTTLVINSESRTLDSKEMIFIKTDEVTIPIGHRKGGTRDSFNHCNVSIDNKSNYYAQARYMNDGSGAKYINIAVCDDTLE